MKIAVVGAGAIGSLLGALLSSAHDVELMTRGEHLAAIKKRGLILKGLSSGTFILPAYDRYRGGADMIIMAVKSYDTESALREMSSVLSDEIILTVQNGLNTWRHIASAVGEERTFIGLTTYGAYRESPGVVVHAGTGWVRIGAVREECQRIAVAIVEAFRRAGINAECVDDVMREIWVKTMINACINPLTALLRVKNGALLEEPLRDALNVLIEECGQLARCLNLEADVGAEVVRTLENTRNNYSSMCQDVMAGRRTEIDAITGAMLERAQKVGVPMNAHRFLYDIVRHIP